MVYACLVYIVWTYGQWKLELTRRFSPIQISFNYATSTEYRVQSIDYMQRTEGISYLIPSNF